MEAFALIFTAVFGLISLVVVGSVVRGWALSIMWAWFFVPLGAPALSLPIAIGVSMVVSFLTHQHIREPKDERDFGEQVASILAKVFMLPLVVLGCAWIVKQFI